MFFLVFLCTLLAYPTPDFTGVPQSQLTQEMIPLLERECVIVEKRVHVKRNFFSGTQTFSEAFWEFSGMDLFDVRVLRAQKNLIAVQYQARLTQTFHNLVDKRIAPDVSQRVSDLVERKWNAENEQDTLTLRMLHLLSQQLEQHADFVQQLRTIEIDHSQILSQKPDPKIEDPELIHVVGQQRYIRQLEKGLIQLWFHNEHTIIQQSMEELMADVDVQKWSLERQKQMIQIFSPWLAEKKYQDQIAIMIKELSVRQHQNHQAKLEEEWLRMQEEWPKHVSKWEEEKAKSEQESLKKQQENLPTDALPLEKKMIAYRLDVLRAHIKQRSTLRTEAQLRESQARLEEAKRKELAKKQSAAQKRIQQEVVRLREMETTLREHELTRHAKVQKHLEQAKVEQVAINALFIEWDSLPPLAASKKDALQTHTKRVHDQKVFVQEQILALDVVPPVGPFTTTEKHPSTEQAIADIELARMDRSHNIQQEQQDFYTIWIAINEHDSRTKNHDVRAFDGQRVWDVVRFEGNHLFLAWGEHVSRTKGWFKDINHILDLVRILLWGGVLVVCWQWISRRVFPSWLWVQTWLREQDRLSVGYNARDDRAERTSNDQKNLIQQIYYLISALCLHFVLYGSSFRVLSSVVVFFVGMRLGSVLTKTWRDMTENQRQLQRSISIFIVAYFGWNILEECMQNLFFAYQVALVLQWVQNIILLLFFAVQLGTWSSFFDQKADATVGLMTLKKMRAHVSHGIVGSRLRSVLSLLIILLDAMGRVVFWCIEHSSLFGSTLARNALEETATKHEGLNSFDSHTWSFDNTVLLEPYKKIILQSIADWKQDRKRGSVVIAADEGMGKSHLVDLIRSEEHDISMHSFLTGDIDRNKNWNRLTVLRWIVQSLDVNPSDIHTAQDVIDVLQKRDSTLFFLDNVHHVFLRMVEGFVVLDTLFTVIQETSNRHCWILTCHLPTWKFITSPATPIQSNFFRTEVHIAPWSVQQLQMNMRKYVEEKEYFLDFSSLTALKNPQSVHRAQMSYWRLLSDASKGNPSTAFELFLLSLFQEEGKESKTLPIKLFPLLKTTEIQKLDDMSCFVLSSIVLHQEIRFSELCRSLQIGSEIIQSICKNLVDMDIVVLHDQEYMVRSIWYPWVERVLLQKRFISMRL